MINSRSKGSIQNFRIRSIERLFARTDYFTRQHSQLQERSSTSIRRRNIRVEPLKQLPVSSNICVQANNKINDLKRIIPKKLRHVPIICSPKPSPQPIHQLPITHSVQQENPICYQTLIHHDEQESDQEEYLKAYWPFGARVVVVKKVSLSVSHPHPQAKMIKQLKHEHILEYLGSQERNGSMLFYSSQMIASNLEQMMDCLGVPDMALIHKVLKQLVSALTYIHSKNYYLTNLNPSKILLDNQGNIKLNIISSKTGEQPITERTLLRQVIWKSPETILESKLDKRSNIWSVGCIALRMITRDSRLMFSAKPFKSNKEFIEYIQSEKEPSLPNISKDLKVFISLCLEYSIEGRPQASELLKSNFLMNSPS